MLLHHSIKLEHKRSCECSLQGIRSLLCSDQLAALCAVLESGSVPGHTVETSSSYTCLSQTGPAIGFRTPPVLCQESLTPSLWACTGSLAVATTNMAWPGSTITDQYPFNRSYFQFHHSLPEDQKAILSYPGSAKDCMSLSEGLLAQSERPQQPYALLDISGHGLCPF